MLIDQNNPKRINQCICFLLTGILYITALLFSPSSPYFILFLFGFHMMMYSYMVIAADTIAEKLVCYIGLFIIGVLFCISCQGWYYYLIFLTIVEEGGSFMRSFFSYVNSFMPVIIYIISFLRSETGDISHELLFGLLLLFICIMYRSLLQFIINYYESGVRMQELLSRSAVTELHEKNLNKDLAMKNYLIERNTRLEERDRISRNIHNVVGHTITTAIMAMDASELLYEVSPKEAMEKVTVAKQRMQQSLESIRSVVRVLDEEITPVSVSDLIQTLVISINRFKTDSQLKIRHNLSNPFDPILIPQVHIEFLNGAMLEALSNGIRHGNATAFIILLSCDKRHLQLTVEDNGDGNQMTAAERKVRFENGFGLKKIEQYLKRCGGDLKINYHDGWKLTMLLPIPEE